MDEQTLLQMPKNWIKKGSEGCHRDHIGKTENLIKIYVDNILRRDVPGSEKKHFVGVKAHWVSMDGKFQQGVLFSKEIIPYEVGIKGADFTNKWINRLD